MTVGSGFCSNHLSLIVGTLRLSWLRNPFSSKIPNQPLWRVYERNLVLKSSKYVELVRWLVGFGGAVIFMVLQSLIWFMSTFCVLCLVWFLYDISCSNFCILTVPPPEKRTSSDISVQQLWPTGAGASAPQISVSKAPNQGQLSHSVAGFSLYSKNWKQNMHNSRSNQDQMKNNPVCRIKKTSTS